MSRNPIPSFLGIRCLPVLALVLIVILGFSSPAWTQAKATESQPRAGHDHDHDHADEKGPYPAPTMDPKDMVEINRLKAAAREKAKADFKALKVDPALATRQLAFVHDGAAVGMGMDLQKAMTGLLAGSNSCTLGKAAAPPTDHTLTVITKDKRKLVFSLHPDRGYLFVTGMDMGKAGEPPRMQAPGDRAAFYLLNFM